MGSADTPHANTPLSDIAVVGMACRFPHARNVSELWDVLVTGEVTFEDIPKDRWNHATFYDPADVRASDKTYVSKGAFIEGVQEFAALHYGLAPRRVQVMDPQHRWLVETVRQAIQDAGYERRPFPREHTGVFVGASVSEYKDLLLSRLRARQMVDGSYGAALDPAVEALLSKAVANVVPSRAFSIAGSLLNMAAATVSQTFDFGGPSFSLDAACSSALVAIHEAVVHLRARQCDVAFAGGVYFNLTPDNLVGFARIGAISPSGICRPFDARADGFVMGEGVGMVMLKRLSDAIASGDRVYAVIRGSGCNNDGRGDGPMTPRPEGQFAAMSRAHSEVDFPVETIGLVETHGTATTVGDVVEVGALKKFFGARMGSATAAATSPHCYLSSIKANIGHTMSAAGVAGFIKAALAIYRKTIPPQPSCEQLNEKLELASSPFRIATTPVPFRNVPTHPRRAAVSSFGFGGTNAHVLLEELPSTNAEVMQRSEPILLSAPNTALLAEYARDVAHVVERDEVDLANAAASLSSRGSLGVRLAFVAATRAELVATLRSSALALQNSTPLPAGVFLGTEAADLPRIAMLFPGQGGQKVNLLKGLLDRIPALRAELKPLVAAALVEGVDIHSALYPEQADAAAQANLTNTAVCQPAMAALSLALHQLLVRCGVRGTVHLGHSLGDFTAAAASGSLSAVDAVRLVARRGRSMNDLPLPDAGAMAALKCDLAAAQELASAAAEVWVANHNHPTQVVVSGTTAGIQRVAGLAAQKQIPCQILAVSHAFHSPLMAGVDAQFSELLKDLRVGAPQSEFISCVTGASCSDRVHLLELWKRHAVSPVKFVDALRAVAAHQVSHLLQVGAGGTLLSFAAAIPGLEAVALKIAQTEGDDSMGLLASALAQLYVAGADINLEPLYEGRQIQLAQLPPTPLETQTYWGIEAHEREIAQLPPQYPTASTATGDVMNDLVKLFREQTELLKAQADILKAQAQAIQNLGGPSAMPSPVVPQLSSSPSTDSRVQTVAAGRMPDFSNLVSAKPAPSEPAPSRIPALSQSADQAASTKPAEREATNRQTIEEHVLAAVSKISAFPSASLKTDQKLTDDLGFDSLMLVELDQNIGKTWPALGGLPRELFSRTTSIADVVNHIVDALTHGPKEAAPAPSVEAKPTELFRAALVPAPLRTLRESVVHWSGPILITEDSGGIGKAVYQLLQERGVSSVLGSEETAGQFDGVIHCAALDVTDSPETPALHLLKLAQRLPADASCFAALTGFGGTCGYQPFPTAKWGQAGVSGFVKSLAHERSGAVTKCIDVDTSLPPATIAAWVCDELFSGDTTVEVGWSQSGRCVVGLEAIAPSAKAPALPIHPLVLVTGGARGIGRHLAESAVRRFQPRLVIWGRSAETSEDVRNALAQFRTLGAHSVSYQQVNVSQVAGVRAALAALRHEHGELNLVIHAAGMSADSAAAGKRPADFSEVLLTKTAAGLAFAELSLDTLVLVGSWSGRFGNAGQTDYSAANDMLAKLPMLSRAKRCVTIDFPPWRESSMVAKIPAFRRAEMEAAGVPFLSVSEGTAAFEQALSSDSGEVLVGRGVPSQTVSYVSEFPVSRLNHVYLNDHQMSGQRVVPLAAAMDHVAAAGADALGATENAAHMLRDFKLERPILVPDTTWVASRVDLRDSDADVSLRCHDAIAYRGKYALLARTPEAPSAPRLTNAVAPPLSIVDFYTHFTFHGPKLQGIESIELVSAEGVRGTVHGCQPSDWIKEPLRSGWTIDPLVIDSSFQLAGYWAWTQHRRRGFPLGFDEYVQLRPFGRGPVRCTATFATAAGDEFVGDLYWNDAEGNLVAWMRGARAEFAAVKDEQSVGGSATADAHPTIAASTYQFDKFPEYEELTERLQLAEAFGLKNPYFSVHERICNDTTVVDGREMINFSSYNYVGNSGDPVVSAAAKAAIDHYGTSVSASRVASGEKPLTGELERALASYFGTEASLVFVSGHATNVTVIGHIVGPEDIIFHDALAHDSIIQGAKLSGAKRRPFPHNDYAALDRMLTSLRGHYRRALVCIEGTYSMDGDIPDLPAFIAVKKKHKALLLVDEAHSAGVVGPTGRGVGEYFNVNRADVDLWMGTLSKSFASCGGYICGTTALVEYLKYTTPGFVYSVGISPPNAAAALAALQQLERHPERPAQARAKAALFISLLQARGIDTGMSKDSAVVPAIIGNSIVCLQLSDRMKQRGINVQPILYPAVEEHAARLRFFLSSTHTEEQLRQTADVLAEELNILTRESAHHAVA